MNLSGFYTIEKYAARNKVAPLPKYAFGEIEMKSNISPSKARSISIVFQMYFHCISLFFQLPNLPTSYLPTPLLQPL